MSEEVNDGIKVLTTDFVVISDADTNEVIESRKGSTDRKMTQDEN